MCGQDWRQMSFEDTILARCWPFGAEEIWLVTNDSEMRFIISLTSEGYGDSEEEVRWREVKRRLVLSDVVVELTRQKVHPRLGSWQHWSFRSALASVSFIAKFSHSEIRSFRSAIELRAMLTTRKQLAEALICFSEWHIWLLSGCRHQILDLFDYLVQRSSEFCLRNLIWWIYDLTMSLYNFCCRNLPKHLILPLCF